MIHHFFAHRWGQRTRFCHLNSTSLEALESQSSDLLQVRKAILNIINPLEEAHALSQKTAEAYRKAADESPTLEAAQGFYEWIQTNVPKSKAVQPALDRIHLQLEEGVQQKIMGKNDQAFLLQAVKDYYNANDLIDPDVLAKLLDAIEGKLDRLKADKQRYEKLIQTNFPGYVLHELPKNERAAFLSENDYLKMTVPERRVFLGNLEKAHSATVVARKKEEEAYAKLLNNPYMGKATVAQFMKEFCALTRRRDRAEWLSEMENGHQIERYEDLWNEIEADFQGTPFLDKMYALKDSMGHSELTDAFYDMKSIEANKLERGYQYQLDRYQSAGIISAHTRLEFDADFDAQTFPTKYDYARQLPMQMRRYEALRHKIDALDPAFQKKARELYQSNQHGYTEIEEWYQSVQSSTLEVANDEEPSDKTDLQIMQLTDAMNDDAYSYAVEWMLSMPTEMKQDLYQLLRGYLQYQSEGTSALDFQDDADREMNDFLDEEMVDEFEEHDLVEPDVSNDEEEKIKNYIIRDPGLSDQLAVKYDALDEVHDEVKTNANDEKPGLWRRWFNPSDLSATDEFEKVQQARRIAEDPNLTADDQVSVDVDRLDVSTQVREKNVLDYAYVNKRIGKKNVVRVDVGYKAAVRHLISDHPSGIPRDTKLHLMANQHQRKVEFGYTESKLLMRVLALDLGRGGQKRDQLKAA
ncbi:hypothetical protein IPJ72_00795 [Candidatus Peregrinibacteria bacterium]|nr:MAG: hypothetical protein IPJ72_00795 [Candidatus Peregrinibacteria bacterium]